MSWIKNNKIIFILLLFCLGFTIYYLYEVIRWIPYHNQIDYGEGYIQYIANQFTNGKWHWDLTTPPYIPLMYGIVEPLVMMPIIKLFGGELWTTRTVMVISTIIIAILIYLIIRRMTGSKVWALVGALLPFTQPIIRDWSLMARVEMLATMFDILGLYLFIRFKDSKYVYLAIIPFTIAFYTKPIFITALLAVLIYLAINKQKVFVKFAGITVIVFGGILLYLQLYTDGQYLFHVYTASKTVDLIWIPLMIQNNMANVLTPLSAMVAFALIGIRPTFKKWSLNVKKLDLLSIFFLCSLLVDFIVALRPGGFINYYIEFIYATCICATLILPRFIKKAQEVYNSEGAISVYAILLVMLFVLMIVVSPRVAFPFPNKMYAEDVKKVTEMIEDTNEPIITENTGLVINAGKELYAEFFIITNWAQLGIWDDTNYINDYKNQKFDYIILRVSLDDRPYGDGHFSREVMDAMKENYTLIYKSTQNYYWYGLSVYKANNRLGDSK